MSVLPDVKLSAKPETTDPSNTYLYVLVPDGGSFLPRKISYNNLVSLILPRIIALEGTSGGFTKNRFLDVSSDFTSEVTANYKLKSIDIKFVSGTPVVSVGTTASGTELIDTESPTSGNPVSYVFNIIYEATQTIYYTISGGVVNITETQENEIFI